MRWYRTRAALDRLDDALAQPKTEWTRDSAIRRFEFTFELAWKAVATVAEAQGVDARSPREAVRCLSAERGTAHFPMPDVIVLKGW